jgi:uncharacterized membrane protein YphA (DoxX/SURF4 family)
MTSAARLAALVRILTGVLFVAEGCGKIFGDFVRGGFARHAHDMLKTSWPFYRTFLESTVVPHASAFAWIVAGAELALGLALLLGLWVRIAAGAGCLLMLSILLAQSYAGPAASWDTWITAALVTKFAMLLLLLLGACDAGRVWGIDGRAAARRGSIRR